MADKVRSEGTDSIATEGESRVEKHLQNGVHKIISVVEAIVHGR